MWPRSCLLYTSILQSTGRDGKKDISFTCSEGEADLAMRVLKESAHFNDCLLYTSARVLCTCYNMVLRAVLCALMEKYQRMALKKQPEC